MLQQKLSLECCHWNCHVDSGFRVVDSGFRAVDSTTSRTTLARANNTETELNPSFTLYSGALVLAVKEITVIKTMWPYTPQSIRPLSPCLTDLSHSLPCQLVNYLFTKDRNRWPMFVLMFFSYQPYTKPNSRNQQTPFAPLIRQPLI